MSEQSHLVTKEVDKSVNYKEGYYYCFQYLGAEIIAKGSAKSGKETILINGKLVSEKRSFFRRSCHKFELDGHKLEMEFYMANMRTGELHCSLIDDDTHVETQKLALKTHYHLTNKRMYIWLPLFTIVGGFCGYYLAQTLLAYLQ